jgi:hypothetical protein
MSDAAAAAERTLSRAGQEARPFRRTTTGMRAILWIGAGFVAVAGLNEYLLSSQTDRFFAWTIKLPLTAAFLGAFYLTALGMAVLSAMQREWSRARVGIPGVAAFLWLTLLATLLHLDLFHFHAGPGTARGAAWAWLVIYIADPVALTTLWILQVRVPGTDRPRTRLLPSWYRGLLGVVGTASVAAGIVLFVAPSSSAHLWPWPLTPLTAQAAGAWLVGYGGVLLTMIVENDWDRVRPALAPSVVLFVLQVIALIRYAHVVDWSAPSAWVFLAMLGGALVIGAAGWSLAQRRP